MPHDNSMDLTSLPLYTCHKQVRALLIATINHDVTPEGEALITPQDATYPPFTVSEEYCRKHNPQAGGYFVVYEDGYQSWSPGRVFEGGYTLAEE